MFKVKHDDSRDGVEREARPDFEQQQMERSGRGSGSWRRGEEREGEKGEEEFKRPRLSQSPSSNPRRGRGGSGFRGGGGGGGGVPGFRKNPGGYTKYSLADVPEMSQSSNTAAAFDFLNQLRWGEGPTVVRHEQLFRKIWLGL